MSEAQQTFYLRDILSGSDPLVSLSEIRMHLLSKRVYVNNIPVSIMLIGDTIVDQDDVITVGENTKIVFENGKWVKLSAASAD